MQTAFGFFFISRCLFQLCFLLRQFFFCIFYLCENIKGLSNPLRKFRKSFSFCVAQFFCRRFPFFCFGKCIPKLRQIFFLRSQFMVCFRKYFFRVSKTLIYGLHFISCRNFFDQRRSFRNFFFFRRTDCQRFFRRLQLFERTQQQLSLLQCIAGIVTLFLCQRFCLFCLLLQVFQFFTKDLQPFHKTFQFRNIQTGGSQDIFLYYL